jgi:putative N6-adenine-specific DNA methylase
VIDQAQGNAEAAGVAPWLELAQGDCRSFAPPEGRGLVVCNPPYGERIGEREQLEQLYGDLGAMLKQRCSGWQLWLLSGNPELTGALRMKASRRIPVSNGGIDCRWLQYEIR